jgi:hypothetical protein
MRSSVLLSLAAVAAANFIPPPKDINILPSENYPGASISYKEV